MNPYIRTLQDIGITHYCDKFTRHNFAPVYEQFFSALRDKPIRILEIGIGGEDFASGGESLKTWQDYFENAQIYGIDIYPKPALDTPRIHTIVCDQTDRRQLAKIAAEYGPFDIIIDDGSHHNDDAVVSFKELFPSLRPGGVYVIEDVQTSYWANYGGSSIAPDCFSTAASWLKRCVDIVNRGEIVGSKGGEAAVEFDIREFHVFHNIAVLIRQDDPTSHVSRVLTPKMRADVAQIDTHRNGRLEQLFSSINRDPSRLGEILASVGTILDGAHAGFAAAAPPSAGAPAGGELNGIFLHYHDTVRNLTATVGTQRGYIQSLEDEKAGIVAAMGEQVAYISDLESQKAKIMADINDYTKYIQSLEVQKTDLETSLIAHSQALRDYQVSIEKMQSYIASLEGRLKSD